MKKSKLIVITMLILVAVLSLGLFACDIGARPEKPSITVDPVSMTITVGQEVDLMAGVTVSGGNNPVVSISDNGGFNKDAVGTYTITYTATNDDVDEAVTATRTITVDPAPIVLTINVNPTEVTMHAGEEISLLFGVTLEGGEGDVIVLDDGGFDADTEGVYTVVYGVKDADGNVLAQAERTITVEKALSPYVLEVRENKLGVNKWPTNTIEFANALLVELNADTSIDTAQSGIFHNASDAAITLNVAGGYGVSAILTANGVVIEGRDGTNGKLVNEANPSRASSSAKKITVDGEEKNVPDVFAREMVIPAGGYAVVIQNGYAGEGGADKDGRSFMNYNVIGDYGNVVRIVEVDSQSILTPYVNQAPVISGNTKIFAAKDDDSFDLNSSILAGISAKDDNGTFELSDDVKVEAITVKDDGGFDISAAGTYNVVLAASDGALESTCTRTVEVREEGIATITVGTSVMKIAEENVAIDKELSSIGNYAFIVYTSKFEGSAGYSNGYGIAYVLDAYGKLVRIYDGSGAKYYDAENPAGVQNGQCTATGYITEALASQQDGEIVVITPNSTANNATGGSRHFFLNNKRIGDIVTITGLKLKSVDLTIEINGKSFTAPEGKWAINDANIATGNAASYKMIVFNKEFTGSFSTNGYGGAIVLDAHGRLVKVYDGGNLGYYTLAGKAASAHFTTANFATVAFGELADGETLIIFPNDGTNAADSARTFCFGLRTDGSIGKIASVNNLDFLSATKILTVGDKSISVEGEKWLYNVTVTAANAPKYGMLIYDKNHAGEVTTNGYGAAIVLDATGKLIKIYDGANGGFYTEAGKAASAHFTTSNYSAIAFSELSEGEILIICPHDGGSNPTRGFLLSLRGVNGAKAYCGEIATLTGFTFTAA